MPPFPFNSAFPFIVLDPDITLPLWVAGVSVNLEPPFRVGQITPGHCWQTHGGPCQAFPPSKWPESSTHVSERMTCVRPLPSSQN